MLINVTKRLKNLQNWARPIDIRSLNAIQYYLSSGSIRSNSVTEYTQTSSTRVRVEIPRFATSR